MRLASPFLLRTGHPPLAHVKGRRVRELLRIGKRVVARYGAAPQMPAFFIVFVLALYLCIGCRIAVCIPGSWRTAQPSIFKQFASTKGKAYCLSPRGTKPDTVAITRATSNG